MLVRITQRCQMQCPHCMVDATPQGAHMSLDTFGHVLDFIRRGGLPIILISGGEPTENPYLMSFLRLTQTFNITPFLLTNGEWLHQWSPQRRDALLDAVWRVQVTNDPVFYPQHVEPFDHEKVYWETQLRQVSPHGRAVTNKLRTNRRAPECFNLRSLVRTMGTFQAARMVLVARGLMCTPSINIDGSISAGEAPECFKIGHVTDDEATIELNLRVMKCEQCGMVGNLEQNQKRAIGEATLFLAGED